MSALTSVFSHGFISGSGLIKLEIIKLQTSFNYYHMNTQSFEFITLLYV